MKDIIITLSDAEYAAVESYAAYQRRTVEQQSEVFVVDGAGLWVDEREDDAPTTPVAPAAPKRKRPSRPRGAQARTSTNGSSGLPVTSVVHGE